MMRAFFLAIGLSLIVLGGELLVVDRVVLNQAGNAPAAATGFYPAPQAAPARRELDPPEWAPWTLMSLGAVVMLYSFTLPGRIGG